MRDRIPTQVVNGAVRMEVLSESGEHVQYLYLKRADEPVENGTPYSVNSVLTDGTATALGLNAAENPTPNDAFAKIAQKFNAGNMLELIDTISLDKDTSGAVSLSKPLSNYKIIVFKAGTANYDNVYFQINDGNKAVNGDLNYAVFVAKNGIINDRFWAKDSVHSFIDTTKVNKITIVNDKNEGFSVSIYGITE